MYERSNPPRKWRALTRIGRAVRPVSLVLALGTVLAGCGGLGVNAPLSGITQTYQRGYILDERALEQVPVGSSQEQVLLVLGTPSTVATVSGEAFYYISQKTQQTAFLPQRVVDQRVLVVYFDGERRVTRIANYGLQDGKVFDFVSRTTPVGGRDITLVGQILRSALGGS
jgi:outer membrane protein assembly factor BamE (lipoprotein component of BamABCDE complex)